MFSLDLMYGYFEGKGCLPLPLIRDDQKKRYPFCTPSGVIAKEKVSFGSGG